MRLQEVQRENAALGGGWGEPSGAAPGTSWSPAPEWVGSPPLRRSRWGFLGRLLTIAALAAAGLFAWHTQVSPFGDRETVTILALGTDREQGGRARSDTMLVGRVQLRPEFRARLVSIYRDTRARVPGYGTQKINAAMAFGGAALARETLKRNFDVAPDREVVVSLEAAEEVVNALGGVTVDVPRRMDYVDRAGGLEIHIPAGRQRLNGGEAVRFLRWRSDGRGDLGRVERQRTFLNALSREALHPLAILRWPVVLGAIQRHVKTDLTFHEVAYLSWRYLRAGPASVITQPVPFRLSRGYVVISPRSLRAALNGTGRARAPRP